MILCRSSAAPRRSSWRQTPHAELNPQLDFRASPYLGSPGCLGRFEETLHRGNQIGSRGGFGHQGIGPNGSARSYRFRRVVDGEQDNFGGRCDLTYLVCSLDAIHDRHIDVEEDEVRMQLFDLLDSLLAMFSLDRKSVV